MRAFGHISRILGHFRRKQALGLAQDYYHQQYLHKNPGGYCNHGFNGVSCPIGVGVSAE